MTIYRCRYCRREATVGPNETLPRDRCPVGATSTRSGSHLWKRKPMPTTYRRGTTVFVVGGPDAGVIGKATGSSGDRVYIDKAFGHNHRLVVADQADVMKAPHPLAWYNGGAPFRHSCSGCDDVEAAKAARR
jgi:hypothetical protein